MKKVFYIFIFTLFCITPVLSAPDFSKMTKFWCEINYEYWPVSEPSSVAYAQIEYDLYFDIDNNKIYDDKLQEIKNIVINNEEIKITENFKNNEKQYIKNYTLNRVTGEIISSGAIRHDYDPWGYTISYDNSDFQGYGKCRMQGAKK